MPNNKPIAYLLEPPKFDISNLYEKYDVRFILKKSEAMYLRTRPSELLRTVFYWTELHFYPEKDYFVLTGNLTMLVIATLAMQQAFPIDALKLLCYDSETETYSEIGNTNVIPKPAKSS